MLNPESNRRNFWNLNLDLANDKHWPYTNIGIRSASYQYLYSYRIRVKFAQMRPISGFEVGTIVFY